MMTPDEHEQRMWLLVLLCFAVTSVIILQSCITPTYTGCRRLQDCPQTPHQHRYNTEPSFTE